MKYSLYTKSTRSDGSDADPMQSKLGCNGGRLMLGLLNEAGSLKKS